MKNDWCLMTTLLLLNDDSLKEEHIISTTQEKIKSYLGVKGKYLIFRPFNYYKRDQIVLNHAAILYMSESAISNILQKIWYSFFLRFLTFFYPIT